MRAALLGALWLGACVRHAAPECALGGEPYQRSELYFGLKRPGGDIEPERFDAFVAQYVVPELPMGFTVLSGEGRWAQDREPSRVLLVLHRGDQRVNRALEAIRTRYKEQFSQQSVLRVDGQACARF